MSSFGLRRGLNFHDFLPSSFNFGPHTILRHKTPLLFIQSYHHTLNMLFLELFWNDQMNYSNEETKRKYFAILRYEIYWWYISILILFGYITLSNTGMHFPISNFEIRNVKLLIFTLAASVYVSHLRCLLSVWSYKTWNNNWGNSNLRWSSKISKQYKKKGGKGQK